MSLPRNDQASPQISRQPPTSLNDLWAQMLALRQDSAQTAEDKCQVALLLATVNKLCEEQTAFMGKVVGKLKQISDSQLKTVNLQEQYKEEIADNAECLLKSLYFSLEDEQKKAFEEIRKNNSEVMLKILADTDLCADKIHTAAQHAKDTTKKLFRITRLGNVLYYIMHGVVLVDILIRAVQFFA